MARLTTGTAAPSVCPYCGQALVDEQAARRVQRREQERMTALRREVENESADRIARLQAQLRQAKKNTSEQRANLMKEAEHQAEKRIGRRVALLERSVREREEENKSLQRRLERLTAHDRGDVHEEDVFERLRGAFRDDELKRTGRSGDILHIVNDRSGNAPVKAGLIVYECKDTARWSAAFLTQVRRAGNAHHTHHLVLVTNAFPPREKGDMCVRDGVVIVRPARLVDLVEVIRQAVVDIHRAGSSVDGQARKSTELYAYMASDEFRQEFASLVRVTDDLGKLLEREQASHSRSWQERRRAYDELRTKIVGVHGRVRSIIEAKPARADVIPLARSGTG